jgi:hypothetical protein
LTEHPELIPQNLLKQALLSPHLLTQRRLPRNRATAQTVWRPASESHNSSHRVAATAVKPAAERRPPWEQKQKIQLRRSDRKVAISTSGQNAAR